VSAESFDRLRTASVEAWLTGGAFEKLTAHLLAAEPVKRGPGCSAGPFLPHRVLIGCCATVEP
jgi:hypothetical protein